VDAEQLQTCLHRDVLSSRKLPRATEQVSMTQGNTLLVNTLCKHGYCYSAPASATPHHNTLVLEPPVA
jgi:hypothetical protein